MSIEQNLRCVALTEKLEPDEERRHTRYHDAEDEYRDMHAEYAWEDEMSEHANPLTVDSRDEY